MLSHNMKRHKKEEKAVEEKALKADSMLSMGEEADRAVQCEKERMQRIY